MPERDDPLVKLGLQLGEAWAAETRVFEAARDQHDDEADAACDAAWDRAGALVDLIDAEPADTFLGAAVKALAQSWCQAGELSSDIGKSDYDSADQRLGAAVRRALLAVTFLPPGPAS